ncbi:TetR/AcrR family transcriptional regulator [Cryobacterium lactosi]|uniref:TetR/AcrR family transcriptional regulator n=1 Tax=Cryobacterium lactosi TaxID=1259202 RepID=A0A4V3IXR4_9MICO|nr:TetR/AcrR family transcriptional regulator [Cryobacterium lactosi]TFD92107.1 TetR/AcrR family transcriptional regulator [Cryobacterium lactosi]
MRSSSRTDILAAALRVVDAAGGVDITYESVAREVGLSKAGLMYHFPSKDDLMYAVIEHVIDRWKVELRGTLGRSFEESTLAERVRAFVEFAANGGATRGEFVVFTEAVRRPTLSGPWLEYLREWFEFGSETDTASLLLVWLATNGLWIAEATNIVAVSPAQRQALISRSLTLIGSSV